jgi:cobalamin biosynthesis protein CobT
LLVDNSGGAVEVEHIVYAGTVAYVVAHYLERQDIRIGAVGKTTGRGQQEKGRKKQKNTSLYHNSS